MTRSTPFQRISTEVLVDNPWHRYCRDRYTLTDGSVGEYYFVDMAGSCGIVPWFEDGTTVLCSVDRYLLDATCWEFPIGGMKRGDEPLALARLELEEETGLIGGEWTKLGTFAPYKGVSNERCHFFVCENPEQVSQKLEPTESIRAVRMPWSEARQKLLGQELPDGQSLSGLMLFERWLATRGRTA
jgi:ADP-ribose pyrophosphatase